MAKYEVRDKKPSKMFLRSLRCGGGNREYYEYVSEEMGEHPWYSHNEDCDFDSTYANIYFKLPKDQTETLAGLLDPGKNPENVWDEFLKNHQG